MCDSLFTGCTVYLDGIYVYKREDETCQGGVLKALVDYSDKCEDKTYQYDVIKALVD